MAAMLDVPAPLRNADPSRAREEAGPGPSSGDFAAAISYNLLMRPDDEICYCYHVSLRKLMHFSRRVKPQRPSQMTGCLNAGTGCGWCIPFLTKLAQNPDAFPADDLKPEEYAERRKNYIKTAPKNRFEDPEPDSAEPPGDKVGDGEGLVDP